MRARAGAGTVGFVGTRERAELGEGRQRVLRLLLEERPLGGAAQLSPRSEDEHRGVAWGWGLRAEWKCPE